jgi:hypothetical protein
VRLGRRLGKKKLLWGLYLVRGITIVAFIAAPAPEASVYAFTARIGVLWLRTIPLTSGIVAHVFGVR